MWDAPALIAWAAGSLGAVVLWQTGVVHLFFLAVPAWVLSGVLYLVLAKKGNGGSSMPADAPGDSAVDSAPYRPLIETAASEPEGTDSP